ncbi:MAG TPA: type II toxin-antitoxin system Phd/YefM family antitoxin [Terriglobales bacterium]|jgi:prevent-host-death family protein
MEQVPISEFKAKCLAIVKEVQRTGKPVQITRFGKPVADLVPPMPAPSKKRKGSLIGSVTYLGDIVGPSSDPGEWEADR